MRSCPPRVPFMRPDRLYLRDIIEAADLLKAFLEAKEFQNFQADRQLRSAVLYQLTIMGEAVSQMSPDTKARHPGVPWSEVSRFRNRTLHGYFSIDWEIVWVAATVNAPRLREAIADVLRAEGLVD
ncbi:MAG: DUF86 domain-containing protein [Dehalococcoidia bacterium]